MQYLVLGCLLAMEDLRWRNVYLLFMLWLALAVVFRDFVAVIELVVCVMMLWLVHQCVTGRPIVIQSWLAWVGRLCFGLYLMHLPILIVTRQVVTRLGMDRAGLVSLVVFLIVTFGIASMSFRFFETPISKFRARYEGGK